MQQQGTKRVFSFIGMALALLIVQQLSSLLGRVVADLFSYQAIDPHDLFARVSVHHIVQMLAALMMICVLAKSFQLDFGMHMGNRRKGFQSVALFTAILGGYIVVAYTITVLTGNAPVYRFALNAQNVGGTLLFQLLLSGPSEELLFRALPITMLVFAFGQSITLKPVKWGISLECIVTALLFSFAHVRWSLSPLFVSADALQLLYSFVLGVFYGIAYQKTGSVVYPMMMHSISNVLMVGGGYIVSALM